MEKNIKKEYIHELSHFAVQQRLAQHCKSTIPSLKKKLKKYIKKESREYKLKLLNFS